MEKSSKFNSWMDSFFQHLWSKRPVDATFAGKNEFNSKLPDVSKNGLENTLNEIRELLSELSLIEKDELNSFQKIDYDLAEGFLKTQEWERSSGYYYTINPVTYTSEAVFGMVSLFISDFRSSAEKSKSLSLRLSELPSFFQAAKENLSSAHPAWIDRAVEECVGGIKFLEIGLPVLKEDENIEVEQELAAQALSAFKNFKNFLENELESRSDISVSAGKEKFNDIMKWCHQSDIDPLAFAAHAENIIAECEEQLKAHAADFGASSPEEALGLLADEHSDIDNYYNEYERLWEESRKLNEREQLVTWPDFPIEYKPIARWAREVQPHTYFLFYRCPPRYNRPDVYRYHIIPIEKDMPLEKQEALLRSNNTTVIKTNHVLHHGGIGHHTQNWNAVRSKSLIGQIAANDGPARLTMLCSGTLAEGWACYISALAGSKGFLTPLEEYAEISSMRRMAARAVVDVKLHYGIFSLQDAVDFYMEKAKMPLGFATSEAVKNSLFPGGAVMYLCGTEGITKLREELKEKKGSSFSLKAFHDAFLSYGDIPVARIAEEMKKDF